MNSIAFQEGFSSTLNKQAGLWDDFVSSKWNPGNLQLQDLAPTWVKEKILSSPLRTGLVGGALAGGLGAGLGYMLSPEHLRSRNMMLGLGLGGALGGGLGGYGSYWAKKTLRDFYARKNAGIPLRDATSVR